MNSLGKTSSTLLLKQPNSLDVDYDQLRKTKSAENIFCPQIIIDQASLYNQSWSSKSMWFRPFLTQPPVCHWHYHWTTWILPQALLPQVLNFSTFRMKIMNFYLQTNRLEDPLTWTKTGEGRQKVQIPKMKYRLFLSFMVYCSLSANWRVSQDLPDLF